MPVIVRLSIVLAALAFAGCGSEQHAATRPPAPKLPEQAVSDAPGLIAVPRLRQAPPVRPLRAARPPARARRPVVHHRAQRVQVRAAPKPAPRVVGTTAAVPVPVQRPLPRPRSRPAGPPIVFDDSG